MADERYPIGGFEKKAIYSKEDIKEYTEQIDRLPGQLMDVVKDFSSQQLDTPYRDGGWTVRQLIHHVADSHLHAYIRMKWALTEANPIIKAYDEKLWARTDDNKADPNLSLLLLKSIHAKWVALIKTLQTESLEKIFTHPQTKKEVRLDTLIALYAWHGRHHLAHIHALKERKGWS